MLFQTALVERGQRCDGAGRARELAKAAGAEEQPRVSAGAALVNVDELQLHVRQLRQPLELEPRQPIGRLLQIAFGIPCGGGRLFGEPGFDVALDFELANVAEQRARLARQTIRFTLQGSNAIRDATALRIWCRRRVLRGPGNRRKYETCERDREAA